MRIAIKGGGVLGVTSAYMLAREGHNVVLIERNDRIISEASASNAGLIAPGHSFAWASPQAPRMLVRSFVGRDSSIALRPVPDPKLVPWGLRFLRECTARRARRNTLTKLKLATESQRLLEQIIADEDIDCSYQRGGVLYLYRSEQELQAGITKMELVREQGRSMTQLSPAQISEVEPALAQAQGTYAGALHGVGDTTADCISFSKELAQRCWGLGVEFQLSTRAGRVVTANGAAVGVATNHGQVDADRIVVTAGAWSSAVRVPGAGRIPVYPAKGYAIDVPVQDEERVPEIGALDERTLVGWSRMGSNLRMSAIAEFTGFDRRVRTQEVEHMKTTGRELFGDALHWERAEVKVGFRPMTPDGPPIVGPSRIENLFYNTGHGHTGWTMACGSAVLLRDALLDRTPELAIAGVNVRSPRW